MNVSSVAEFLMLWTIVNAGATLVLAVLSYLSSGWVLDWLESLDRWMYARTYARGHKSGTESESPHAAQTGPKA